MQRFISQEERWVRAKETEQYMKEPKQDQANIQLPRMKKSSKPVSTWNTDVVLLGKAEYCHHGKSTSEHIKDSSLIAGSPIRLWPLGRAPSRTGFLKSFSYHGRLPFLLGIS
jgi:hypothetical protein